MSHGGFSSQDGISYVKEIQLMMHGFGDVPEPLLASAQLIENILLQQMGYLWRSALNVAQMQESNKPTIENFVFLLRKDPIRLKRFIRYLQKKKAGVALKMSLGDEIWPKNVASERLKKCLDFLQLIAPGFDPLEEEPDDVYMQRKIRADLMTRNLNKAKYMEFTKARQASFGHGKFFTSYNGKFREWLGKIDCNSGVTNETCDVMAYFAYEVVGEIVDLAFLVRKDSQSKESWERDWGPTLLSIGRSPANKLMQHQSPISPNEIREAMRRFESMQNVPGFLFARQMSREKKNFLDALDALGLKRYCCRRMLLGHVDLIEKLLNYAPLEK
ncbi:hypothetical protein RUM43_002638 [Polyplax serrata]|uniref:Uncharacterized protein n=1 Tax=Polyplax serrata TaxID=468196 RepID=A0AAN8S4Z2_POLSC